MTALLLAARQRLRTTTLVLRTGGVERGWVVGALLVLALINPTVRDLLLGSLAEAWISVGVFVALTFFIFFYLEQKLRIDTQAWLEKHRRFEIPLAALLGATPGCGGAIMVITQYTLGRTSFGAVVAVLCGTMGDAAFLLLARQPLTALTLIGVGFVVGTISGWVVNRIHRPDFLQMERRLDTTAPTPAVPVPSWLWAAWGVVFLPSLLLAVLDLFQVDADALGFPIVLTVGVVGGILSLVMWALSPTQAALLAACRPEADGRLVRRVALNTNFVTIWVVLAFLFYEGLMTFSGIQPREIFAVIPGFMPLLGVLVGFLPGCGPQILVSTLYLNGIVPFSTQLGNTISNDGDALFPAIAMAPRTALIATLYTAVPALLVGYGYYVLSEM